MSEPWQSANSVVMIRPHRFYSNPETAADNAFQQTTTEETAETISHSALQEFDRAVEQLRRAGVIVHVFADTPAPAKPDAIFPNNWFSTHHDGRIALYPMYSPARRSERRADVIDGLREFYRVSEVVDYSDWEKRDLFLEGTGSLVLDHLERVAYVTLSKRADLELLDQFCADFNYEALAFETTSEDGRAIYHTNVMLCIGTKFALVGLDSIGDLTQRNAVEQRLRKSGREIIALSREQIANFAGNALELHNEREQLLVLSARALSALTSEQQGAIERHARLLPLSLPTIELAGGSARCMMATVHLPPR